MHLLGSITQIGLDPSASCMQCSARIFTLRAYGASKLCADLIIFVRSIGKTLQLLDLLFLCCDSYFSNVEVLGFFGCTMAFHSTNSNQQEKQSYASVDLQTVVIARHRMEYLSGNWLVLTWKSRYSFLY
ncbi:hypothetical protein D5086_004657 [Populus alba]|uniref:Uncharacterized protein n=1 Tax=Populus alba TaxID=43335 RepID=A0ACC4CS63_POPAL